VLRERPFTHIPDNYLSPATCAVMATAMAPVWTVAVRKISREVSRTRIPLLGIGAAFSFLIMMFNVPLPGGTSGHAVGGTLLAVVLGPWSACISITIALLIQSVMFGDGGILSFAANSFNMAFVLPFLGYLIYRLVRDRIPGERGEYAGLAVGSYVGLSFAALTAAIEFGLQPVLFKDAAGLPLYNPYPLSITVPAMLVPHLAVAGIVEAVFSVGIFTFIRRVAPGMIQGGDRKRTKAVYAFLVGLICLSPIGLLAAGTAWGEWATLPAGMAKRFGFSGILPGYAVNGLPGFVGYAVSAIAGAAVMIIVFKLVSLKRSRV